MDEVLPKDMIYYIALKCTFRSLVQLSLTSFRYNRLLKESIVVRKRELFERYTYKDDKLGIEFRPGPAIAKLPEHFPIRGIYFIEIVDENCLNYFFSNFYRFLKNKDNFIATVDTKAKKVHKSDVGHLNFQFPHERLHWNDLDYHNYRKLFRKGKSHIKKFWADL